MSLLKIFVTCSFLATAIYFSFITKFIQIRKFKLSLRLVASNFRKRTKLKLMKEKGDISPFSALMINLGITGGMGNFAGVATALAVGGPGAIFWMWLVGFLGMPITYAEGFLGVKYRRTAENHTMSGGPMYYLRESLKNKYISRPLAITFAVCGLALTLFLLGNVLQSNSMALANSTQFNIPRYITALLLAVSVGIVIIGGVKRIGFFAERLVPILILLSILGTLSIIAGKFTQIPAAIILILKAAFSTQAMSGALLGTILLRAFGLAGSRVAGVAAVTQAAAKSPDPAYNGLIAMSGVFIALAINTLIALSVIMTSHLPPIPTTTVLALGNNSSFLPFGKFGIAFTTFVFGFIAIISWAYYGERCFEFIFGTKSIKFYRLFFIFLLFLGGMLKSNLIIVLWNLSELSIAALMLANIVGLIRLAKTVASTTQNYYQTGQFEELL